MNTLLKNGFTSAIIGCLVIFLAFSAAAQTNNNLLTLSFQKTDGKLFKLNAENEKNFDFTISGVKSESDIDAFKVSLGKQPNIRFVTIIPTAAADYQATVCLTPNAKVKDFKQALINMGYSSIQIDGETKSLSEPDKQ